MTILIAVWQLATFQYTLKWDAIDITLPWRYFVSDAIYRNGEIPWWNPFQHHGFAQGMSMETWYPLAHLVSLGGVYNLYSLNLEYIIHLLIASFGFYRLAKALGITHQGAIWGALVFPLSGFFLGNSQHTGWIASAAWMPHLLASFWYWIDNQNLRNTLALLIIAFMMVSGGYIAYTIIMGYVFLLLWIRHIFSMRSKKLIESFLWISLRSFIYLILLLSVLLVSMWMLKDQIDRGQGLEGEALVKGSLYFKHLISLVLPFATLKGTFDYWQGDQALMNLYTGIPALILLILSLKRIDQSFYRFWWIMVITSLSLALAVELPFRGWMNILPFFDLFRLPSLFRYFTILSFSLIAAKMIGDHPYPNDEASRFRKLFNRLSVFLAGVFTIALLTLSIRRPEAIINVVQLNPSSISEAMIFQLLIHLSLLGAFLLTASLLKNKIAFYQLMLIYTALDLTIAFQLNSRVSLLSELPLRQMQTCIDELPQGYPTPPTSDVLGSNSDKTLYAGSVYRNTNTLFKRIGWDGYTPYQYQQYIEFEKTTFFQKALGLPSIFLSKPLSNDNPLNFFTSDPIFNPAPGLLQISEFNPNSCTVITRVDTPRVLIYNQNFIDGWKASVDDRSTELIRIDHSLMGVHVPSGEHEIKFFYDPGNLRNALWISSIALFTCLVFFFWLNRNKKSYQIALILLGTIFTSKSYQFLSHPKAKPSFSNATIINQVDEMVLSPDLSTNYDRFLDKGDLPRFRQYVENQVGELNYLDREVCAPQHHLFGAFVDQHYKTIVTTNRGKYILKQASNDVDSLNFRMFNGFEANVSGWYDADVAIRYEKDNLFQSLKNRNFSATYELDLSTIPWEDTGEIEISLDYRNTEPIESSLIFTLKDVDKKEIVWKSQKLADHQKVSWRKKAWTLTSISEWNDAGYLTIYVWNQGKTNLEIDNFQLNLRQRTDK